MKKRFLSLLLAVVMVLCMLPTVTATAAVTDPAFTTQPVGGDTILKEKLTVSWQTNFTPTKLQLVKVRVHPVDGEVPTYETLSTSATSVEIAPGFDYYMIRAYYSDTQRIVSEPFYVTSKAPYTEVSRFVVGGKAEVDGERIAESDDSWMTDYFDDAVTYQWYRNGVAISGATGQSYTFTASDVGKEIYAVVKGGTKTLSTPAKTVAAASNIYVGGVQMEENKYLPSNGTALQNDAPSSGGYAVLKKGVLELHDFTYTGSGRREIKVGTTYTDVVIGSNEALSIAMYGTNTIVTDDDTIVAVNGSLSISAYGATLNASSGTSTVLFANGAIILSGGTYSIKEAYRFALISTSTVDDIILQAVTLTAEALDVALLTDGVISISDSTLNFPSIEFYMIIADKGIEITRSTITCADTFSAFVSDVAVTLVDCALNIKGYHGFDKGVDSSVSVSISGCTGKIESYGSMFYMRGDWYTLTASGSTELTLLGRTSGYFIGDVTLKLNDGLKAGILHQDNSWSIFNGTYTGDWIGLAIGADPQKPHSHSYNGYPAFDDTHHWDECTSADCPDKEGSVKNKAEHVFSNDADAECNSCKYVRVPPHVHTYGDYTITWYDHSMQCTDPDCPALGSSEKDAGYHTFVDGVCSVCGTDSIVLIDDVPLKDGQYMASGSTTVSTTKPSTDYAYYKDNVLTLHDFTLSGVDSSEGAAIAHAGDLQVVLEGSNTLETPDDEGIVALGDLQISGTGSLDMDTYCEAILSYKNLTVTGVTLNVYSGDSALYGDGTVTLKNCIVKVATDEDGIIGYYGVSITGSAVTITECYDGIESEGDITITNSTVTVTNAEDDGIGPDGNVTISNSTVKLNTEYGIYCYGNIAITDSDVTIHSNDYAIRGEDLTIQGSDVLLCGNGSDGDEALYIKGTLTYDSNMKITVSEYTDGSNPIDFDINNLSDYLYLKFETEKVGWIQRGDNWYFYENNAPKTGWVKDGGYWYYMNAEGAMQTGWVKSGNYWYYMNKSGVMTTGWVKVGNYWYYMNSNGVMQTGWQTIGGQKYYFTSGGTMATGLTKIDGKTYCFASGGSLQIGWANVGGKWYFTNASGIVQTGWVSAGGKWYYMDANGVMQTGWQTIGGKKYYFEAGGAMVTGAVKIGTGTYCFGSGGALQTNAWFSANGKWYLADANGIAKTGWVSVSGKWYYMDTNGIMQTGLKQIGGKWYYLDANGVMQTGWQTVSGKRHLFATGGAAVTGWHQEDGKWYFLSANGSVSTGWVSAGGKWYYMDANGVMQTGWLKIGNYWYYLNKSGVMVTGTQVIDGKTYQFNASGVWVG